MGEPVRSGIELTEGQCLAVGNQGDSVSISLDLGFKQTRQRRMGEGVGCRAVSSDQFSPFAFGEQRNMRYRNIDIHRYRFQYPSILLRHPGDSLGVIQVSIVGPDDARI